MTERQINLVVAALAIFFALLLLAVACILPANAQTQMGPIRTPQINTQLYVGQGAFNNIQATVTFGCQPGGASGYIVIILPGVNPSDSPTIAQGCTKVTIRDDRVSPPTFFLWNGTTYVIASYPGGGGGGGGATLPNTLNVLAGNGSGGAVDTGVQAGAAQLTAGVLRANQSGIAAASPTTTYLEFAHTLNEGRLAATGPDPATIAGIRLDGMGSDYSQGKTYMECTAASGCNFTSTPTVNGQPISGGGGGGGVAGVTVIAPSGDTTGATDGAAIQNACNNGTHNVQLVAGNYYVGANNTAIDISHSCRVFGVGSDSSITNMGTTNDVFRIRSHETLQAGTVPPAQIYDNQMLDIPEFAFFKIVQGPTVPTAGFAIDAGSGYPYSNVPAYFTTNLRIHDLLILRTWGGIYFQPSLIWVWVYNNQLSQFIGGGCIHTNTVYGSGDFHFTDNECSGFLHSGIEIDSGEVFHFMGNKLNGSGITFRGSNVTQAMMFENTSLESVWPVGTTPCAIDFGTGSTPILGVQFANGQVSWHGTTVCNAGSVQQGLAMTWFQSTASSDYTIGLHKIDGYMLSAPPGAQELADFAGTAGTPVSSYTTSTGGSFVLHTGNPYAVMPVLSGSQSAIMPSGAASNAQGVVIGTQLPASANYTVSAMFTMPAPTTDTVQLLGRAVSASVDTQYVCIFSNGLMQLFSATAGTYNPLGNYNYAYWTAGAAHKLSLTMGVGTVKCLIDDTVGVTASDSSITANGYAGFNINGSSSITNYQIQ